MENMGNMGNMNDQPTRHRRPSAVRRLLAALLVLGAATGISILPMGQVNAAPNTGVQYGKDWLTGPLPKGVTKAKIDAVVSPAMGSRTNPNRVRSAIVVIGDKIVYERYHPLDKKTSIMATWSVSKSFTSTVIGALVDDGLLGLDTTPPVPSWSDPADPRRTVTLRNLLHMSSGLTWDEECRNCANDLVRLVGAPSAAQFAASKSLEKQPNTEWEYSSGTSAIVADLVYQVAGSTTGGDAYMKARVLDPIGIKSFTPTRDSTGRFIGYAGADMTARDMARLGLLYLNRGLWGGKRVISESWVDFVKTPSTTNPAYGGHFWIYQDGAYLAKGAGGQRILIVPNKKMVVVVTTQFANLEAGFVTNTQADALIDKIYALFPNQ